MRRAVWMGVLWVVLAGAFPTVAQEAAPEEAWVLEDRVGDASIAGQPTELSSHLDIVSLSITNEDELGLDLVVTFAKFNVEPEVFNADGYVLRFEFNVEGAETGFWANAYMWGAPAAPGTGDFLWQPVTGYSLCHRSAYNCLWAAVTTDEEAKSLTLYLRKDRLETLMQPPREGGWGAPQGAPATPPQREPFLHVGTKVTEIAVSLFPSRNLPWDVPTDPSDGDRLPDTGTSTKPYAFKMQTANQELMVLLGNSYFYSPGELQTVEFRIVNYAASKRLVKLSYELLGPGADQYKVKGPTNLSIPAGQTRTFTFDLDAPATDAPAELRIRADAQPLGQVGLEASTLRRGIPLDPTLKELRVVRRDPAEYGGNPYCMGFECSYTVLTGPDPLPGFVAEGTMAARYSQQGAQYGFWAGGSPASAFPFVLEKGGQVEVTVGLRSLGMERESRAVRALVVYRNTFFSETLLDSTQEETIGTETTTLTFKSAPRAKTSVLPGQGWVSLQVDVPPEMLWLASGRDYVMDVGATRVRLPIGELPTDYLTKPAPSPFRLRATSEREDFVNPGESRLFNLSIYNQDTLEQRARIEYVVSDPAWEGEVLPGLELTLMPGDTVNLGAVLRAPAGATDGQTASMLVKVLSDTGAAVDLNLTAIVVSTADFADDAGRFAADADDLRKFETPTQAKTSALAAPAVLALLALLGFALRHRA